MKNSTSKLISLIEKHGLDEASKLVGTTPLNLLKLTNSPIESEEIYDMFRSLVPDLLRIQEHYRGCDLTVDEEGFITWACNFNNETRNESYETQSISTPYFTENKVPVETIYIDVFDYETGETIAGWDKYYTDYYKCPDSFENVDEFVNWYKTQYLPQTYNLIEYQLQKHSNEYLK